MIRRIAASASQYTSSSFLFWKTFFVLITRKIICLEENLLAKLITQNLSQFKILKFFAKKSLVGMDLLAKKFFFSISL